jgi:hypothetical protein
MMSVRFAKSIWLPLLLGIIMAPGCSKKAGDRGPVLAMVDGDPITVNDFVRRTEFHVRPDYCQDSSMQAKRICLNSLIAEKLYAREARQDTAITRDARLQARLQGIREQTMREELVRRMVMDKLHIPDEELRQAYAASLKTVTLEAMFVPALSDLTVIERQARSGVSFAEIAKRHPGLAEPVQREVGWGHVNDNVQKVIFSDSVKQGDVLGPLPVETGYGLFKVLGWQKKIELSEQNRRQEMDNVKKRLEDYYIRKNYYSYAQNIMKGKRIDFSPQGWNTLVNILAPVYVHAVPPSDSLRLNREDTDTALQRVGDMPLLTLDGQVWTIADLRREVAKHPLEISMQQINARIFPRRLQRAIAGLITDKFLTAVAYEQKLNRLESVDKVATEWQTAFYFVRHREAVLHAAGFKGELSKEYLQAFDRFLNPYFEKLKIKYDDRIAVDYKELERVAITDLPMLVRKSKGPFLDYVPPFPLVSNSLKANYRKIQN